MKQPALMPITVCAVSIKIDDPYNNDLLGKSSVEIEAHSGRTMLKVIATYATEVNLGYKCNCSVSWIFRIVDITAINEQWLYRCYLICKETMDRTIKTIYETQSSCPSLPTLSLEECQAGFQVALDDLQNS